ncbi:MAG: Tat pathway signal protein [Arachnia propionica]|nr:MAG: Tat pathway signal protein [Arachnia propionica]
MHHCDEGKDELLVNFEGQFRSMSAAAADHYVANRFAAPELDQVAHLSNGPNRVSRRHLLGGTAAGFGALLATSALPRYAYADPDSTTGNGHLLVCVFLRGGFDGLSAVVPVADSAYYDARPEIAVASEHTLDLDGTWGLNQNMAALLPLWQDGELAIVQGSGTPEVSRSHFQDQATVERAAPANTRSGWLGRHLQTSSAEHGTFRGITLGTATVLSLTTTAFNTLAISSIEAASLESWGDDAMLASTRRALDQMYGQTGGQIQAQADLTFDVIDTLAAVRANPPQPPADARYPATDFGRGLAEIAKLAKAGLGMEVAAIDLLDWDMHQDLGQVTSRRDWFSRLANELATGLAAFRLDLGERWQTTTVVTMSEFGRRVSENGDGGLDHGHGNTMFVLGGGINGGQVFGEVPQLREANLELGDVPITVDYRQALSEIVAKQLGNAAGLAEVFPGFTPGTELGIIKSS